MRYQDFDVILFPGTVHSQRVPLPEFRTTHCFTTDPDAPAALPKLQLPTPGEPGAGHEDVPSPVCLPTVHTFVPRLGVDERFVVSIHSWARLIPSPFTYEMAAAMSNEGMRTHIAWEFRVFVDGVPVASSHCVQDTLFPFTIDSAGHDARGLPIPLTFPPQPCPTTTDPWIFSPASTASSVKIVITEGFLSYHTNGSIKPYFTRTRNVCGFIARYCERAFLEAAGLYYPSTRPLDLAAMSLVEPRLPQLTEAAGAGFDVDLFEPGAPITPATPGEWSMPTPLETTESTDPVPQNSSHPEPDPTTALFVFEDPSTNIGTSEVPEEVKTPGKGKKARVKVEDEGYKLKGVKDKAIEKRKSSRLERTLNGMPLEEMKNI
ncbi:hypothetical protein SAICODRAFT_114581 [Saitoella complicata NRRL Y-17804]|uniref:Uncharacterized protein n=1 Tax=Saitoella complicata (strain BCRC 22490 / CBS 7301 / JCM 7358 / NBRC 10748 / NRRL Y-17804) TaxID=698492 RepID=A0A0E9NRH7_SAICN|nr:uncharacterized protein SAICODRAFT_114581 [Saitoella complicata NRRL Y-17804]ODQ53430.1 hypothetical protein SAICODRAFT_114581 [Saitoella complicata NRRL Y-17804]GAO52383.1 hypothetical protein G7K_6461-t1 [Saitoella complicata NRRL Y-17804]